jgi:hypothetical protein
MGGSEEGAEGSYQTLMRLLSSVIRVTIGLTVHDHMCLSVSMCVCVRLCVCLCVHPRVRFGVPRPSG